MDATENRVKEAQRAYQRAWRKKNPEKVKEYNRKYWERKIKELEKSAATATQ